MTKPTITVTVENIQIRFDMEYQVGKDGPCVGWMQMSNTPNWRLGLESLPPVLRFTIQQIVREEAQKAAVRHHEGKELRRAQYATPRAT